jgi:acyl dehydratase
MHKDAAKKLGLSDPILHGMCTLGLAAHPIVERAAAGDVSRLKRFGCRFARPLYMTGGRSLVVRQWHSAGPTGPLVAFEISDDAGDTVVKNGFAEFGR